ncbi:MAG: hypothetical protein HQL93_05610 [Magnetococcales bacterium]|nr:hypothetical protein [Magnetococcales bacterium]
MQLYNGGQCAKPSDHESAKADDDVLTMVKHLDLDDKDNGRWGCSTLKIWLQWIQDDVILLYNMKP